VARRPLCEKLYKPRFMFYLFLHYGLCNGIGSVVFILGVVAHLAPRTNCASLRFQQNLEDLLYILPVVWKIRIWATCNIGKLADVSRKSAADLIETRNHCLKVITVLYSCILYYLL